MEIGKKDVSLDNFADGTKPEVSGQRLLDGCLMVTRQGLPYREPLVWGDGVPLFPYVKELIIIIRSWLPPPDGWLEVDASQAGSGGVSSYKRWEGNFAADSLAKSACDMELDFGIIRHQPDFMHGANF
ncbi:hypothetical protein COLO4_29428 [Corchorus olitorius]|uniref:Uncharacterized protein n=1 Tax=Corchorus olitorius TaxID=93759 RepID=A0A1R3HEM0_9ROSI|nr:hypothetical protein COLO4_29428 [Corchorus olitorius]